VVWGRLGVDEEMVLWGQEWLLGIKGRNKSGRL